MKQSWKLQNVSHYVSNLEWRVWPAALQDHLNMLIEEMEGENSDVTKQSEFSSSSFFFFLRRSGLESLQ